MKEKIEQFLKDKELLTNELKEWVKDKNIPLEERWEVFIKSSFGSHKPYYYEFKSLDQESFYDEDIIQTNQLLNVKDVIKWAQNDYDKVPYTEKEIDKFKEEALNDFIYSWEFNW